MTNSEIDVHGNAAWGDSSPNDLENFKDTVERRRPSRLLFHADFTPDLRRRVVEHIGADDIDSYFGFARRRRLSMRRPADLPPLDTTRFYGPDELPEGTTFNAYGVAKVPSNYYHFYGYLSPLRNASRREELEAYPLDDMSQWDTSWLKEEVDAAHEQGRIVVGTLNCMFEHAWQIRGLEPFLMDLAAQPDWADVLLARIAEQNMAKARAFAAAGADCLDCGDDVATQQGPMFRIDVWREHIHKRWTRVWDEAKRIHPDVKIHYHSDGNILSFVDELVEGGVDILNPLQPECLDVDEVHRRHGRRITFDGCMGTQSTMPFGSAEDVRARVHGCVEKYGQEGGLILSPTHVLEPEVPLENIVAFAEACGEYDSGRRRRSGGGEAARECTLKGAR